MKALFKVFTILTPDDKFRCSLLGAAMLMGAFWETIGIGLIFPFISIMGQPDWLAQHENVAYWAMLFGASTHKRFVILCTAGLLGVFIFKNVYLVFQMKMQAKFLFNCQAYYASRLYALYLQKNYMYHLNHNTAVLLRNTYEGARNTFGGVLLSVFGLLTELITALVIFGLLVYIDAFTAIIVSGAIGILAYAVLKNGRMSISSLGVQANTKIVQMHQWVNQGLGSIKETKILGKEKHFFEKYDDACRQYCDVSCRYYYLQQLPRFLLEVVVVFGLLLLIIVKIMIGETPVEIVPFLGLLALASFRLMPCFNRCITYINTIRFNLPLFNELYDDFCLIRETRKRGANETLFGETRNRMRFLHDIRIDGVSFHYPEMNQAVLSNVSLVIPKGSFVGIIGASGAGKTTFVDILLGLLQQEHGQILVDGHSIHEDFKAWQAILSYVPQSIYLVDGTIRENIALGLDDEEIDDQRVETVLRMAELYNFVASLPNGVETIVGERGVKLSGGQRQRIGIARALYYEPEVLVLDEATSALDDETEKSITTTILKLKRQITIIAVAHRVTTLEDCDFKIRFEDGKVTVET